MTEKIISLGEVRRNTGERGSRKWIAHDGVVYDVTDCPHWQREMHERLHFPGQDLSGELADAPHKDDVFTRPCVKIVGKLAQ
jgi:predicted heme/steroid binding protein